MDCWSLREIVQALKSFEVIYKIEGRDFPPAYSNFAL